MENSLHFKVVHEKSLAQYQNIVFKKLYCISNEPSFNIQNMIRIQDSEEDSSQIILKKSLIHPSVKTVRQIPTNATVKHEEIQAKKEDPFNNVKKKSKAGLNKESFFASFRKVKGEGKEKEEPKTQAKVQNKEKAQDKGEVQVQVDNGHDSPIIVKTKKAQSELQIKQKKGNRTAKNPVMAPNFLEKIQNQEAALVNLFENEIQEDKESHIDKKDDSKF